MSSTDFVKPDDVPVQNIAVCLQDTSPIDPVKYSLSPEEAEFFKATTGINDDEALKAHILSVQEKAYKVSD